MKKTIAILLVLVIGMVGVFAATADILLTTTIAPINQMAIVAEGTVLADYAWPEGAPTTVGTSSIYGTTATALVLSDALEGSFVRIAELFARSNNRGGVSISFTSTSLTDSAATNSASANSKNIDYSFRVYDDITSTVVANVQYVNGEVSGTTDTDIGTLAYNNAGFDMKGWGLELKLDEELDNAAAGTYAATITVTFTANA